MAKAATVGRVGGMALIYFVLMSTFALVIGLVVGNLIKPGEGLNITANADKGAEYAEYAKEEADRLYRAGERKAQEVAQYAGDYYDEMSDMVRRKPAQALGIAAGVGFLVGLILARR